MGLSLNTLLLYMNLMAASSLDLPLNTDLLL